MNLAYLETELQRNACASLIDDAHRSGDLRELAVSLAELAFALTAQRDENADAAYQLKKVDGKLADTEQRLKYAETKLIDAQIQMSALRGQLLDLQIAEKKERPPKK